jgi:hypothetical protein
MQRTYAFEDQRAVRWRVTLAVARFRPLVTGGILPGRLIVLTGYAHTTSVAGAAGNGGRRMRPLAGSLLGGRERTRRDWR